MAVTPPDAITALQSEWVCNYRSDSKCDNRRRISDAQNVIGITCENDDARVLKTLREAYDASSVEFASIVRRSRTALTLSFFSACEARGEALRARGAVEDAEALDAEIGQNQAALEASGHWGVPTLVFNGEPFFGQDRIDMAIWRMEQEGLVRR